jgi:hypothetical protein
MRSGRIVLIVVACLGIGAAAAQAQCCGDTAAYTTYYAAPACSAGTCGGCAASTCGTSCSAPCYSNCGNSCYTSYYTPYYTSYYVPYYTSYYTPYYSSYYTPYYTGYWGGSSYGVGYSSGCCGR